MTITLIPGYTWKDGELDSAAKRNLAANPTINLEGAIGAASLGAEAVLAAALAHDAVTTIKILDANVTNSKLAPGAVTPDKSTPGAYWYAAGTLSAGVYAVTLSPALPTYATGAQFSFKADVANSGAVDVNVNALGAKNIFKFTTRELEANDILAGQIVTLEYDGTNFQLVSNPNSPHFTSSNQTIPAAAGAVTVAHGLGAVPRFMQWVLVCTDAGGDLGYAQNDEVTLASVKVAGGVPDSYVGTQEMKNATNCVAVTSQGETSLRLLNKSTFANGAIAGGKWALKVYASL